MKPVKANIYYPCFTSNMDSCSFLPTLWKFQLQNNPLKTQGCMVLSVLSGSFPPFGNQTILTRLLALAESSWTQSEITEEHSSKKHLKLEVQTTTGSAWSLPGGWKFNVFWVPKTDWCDALRPGLRGDMLDGHLLDLDVCCPRTGCPRYWNSSFL